MARKCFLFAKVLKFGFFVKSNENSAFNKKNPSGNLH